MNITGVRLKITEMLALHISLIAMYVSTIHVIHFKHNRNLIVSQEFAFVSLILSKLKFYFQTEYIWNNAKDNNKILR